MKFKAFLQSTCIGVAITGVGALSPAISNSPPPDEDFKEWLDLCRHRIISAGGLKISELTGRNQPVSCTFYIRKDGTLGDLNISGTSGNKEIDQAAIDSLNKAAPFPECNIPPTDRTVLVIFDKKITLHHYQTRVRK
ncbi:MAG: cell envelope integrity protein TolA [Candidatus Obscuribacter phosphatis]|uniref:Cell envelope integrity protein TolA n=1 Tax=Candidatus Obscuribacter phosphatis TaxID=1906157 RepID=A0A8J7TMF7_9BACT|nr:cell envelope integrity protein TolA [Candidatus Obscuribacter phosphatis]